MFNTNEWWTSLSLSSLVLNVSTWTQLAIGSAIGAIHIYFPHGCSCDIRIVHYHFLLQSIQRIVFTQQIKERKSLRPLFAHELSFGDILTLFHTQKIPEKFHVCVFQVSNHWEDKGFVVFGISLGWLVGWVGLGWLAERIKRREKKKKITRDSKWRYIISACYFTLRCVNWNVKCLSRTTNGP